MPDPRNRPGGVLALIPHGNTSAIYSPPGPPGIDNRVFMGFSQPLSAPAGKLPRVPIIERITPRSLPAQRTIRTTSARLRVQAFTTARKARNTVAGILNAAKMRR